MVFHECFQQRSKTKTFFQGSVITTDWSTNRVTRNECIVLCYTLFSFSMISITKSNNPVKMFNSRHYKINVYNFIATKRKIS